MTITTRQKIYLAAASAAVISGAFIILAAVGDARIAKAERAAEAAVENARRSQAAAEEKEKKANEYRSKIEYLEERIAGVRAAASLQAKEAMQLDKDISAARADAARAARVRSVAVTAAELCRRLAELGHPCIE